MKTKDLENQNINELAAKQAQVQKEYFATKQAVASGQEKNTAKVKQLRRDRARILTVAHNLVK